MSYKPSDLFVGVIDFFAVLLPGAIIVVIAYPRLPSFVMGDTGILPPIDGATAGWIAFLLAAYLAGHLLFLVGAALDSAVYDPLRPILIPTANDKTFAAANAVKDRALRHTDHDINAFQWAHTVLRLRAPRALVEVERYEADSKFFRSLCVALYVLVIGFLHPMASATECVQGAGTWLPCLVTTGGLLAALAIPIAVIAAKAQRDRAIAAYKALVDAAKQEGKPLPNRREESSRAWYVIGVLTAALLVVLVVIPLAGGNAQALVLFALGCLCLWRYGERRWKSTRTAYQYLVALDRKADTRAPRRSGGRRWNSNPPAPVVEQAGAIAIVRSPTLGVLLVRPRYSRDAWIFPKGTIESGESAAEAAVRELGEEAGIAGRPIARVGSISFARHGERFRVEYFLIERLGYCRPTEVRDLRWCSIADALDLLTYPDARRLLERVARLYDAPVPG